MAKSGNYDENGQRKGFVFYRNFRDFIFDNLNDIQNNSSQEYSQDLQDLFAAIKGLLDFGLEDISENDLLEIAYSKTRYRDFLKAAKEAIKSARENGAKGKNNYPLDKISNGEEVKEWLDERFNNFMKPKQIQTIARKLAEERENIDFLDYCYNELNTRGTFDQNGIAKMFAAGKIFEDDFLVKYRQIQKPLETLCAEDSESNVDMFDGSTEEEILF